MKLVADEVLKTPLEATLAHFDTFGWAHLPGAALPEAVQKLRARIQAIMMGEGDASTTFFYQEDGETGRYEDVPIGKGYVGPSLEYRKLEKLERDPLLLEWIENPLFERIVRCRLGTPALLYRAILMSKSARGGSDLPWHQDAGSFWGLDRTPELQIWTALHDAPRDGGCVEVIPESHRDGLATPLGGVIPAHVSASRETDAVPLPVRAGDVLLIHNLVWHRSRASKSGQPRWALSVSYLSGDTHCVRKKRAPREFVRLWVRGDEASRSPESP